MRECPFCGIMMEPCDESPLYGKSSLHPPNTCWLAGQLFFENSFINAEFGWNDRASDAIIEQLRSDNADLIRQINTHGTETF